MHPVIAGSHCQPPFTRMIIAHISWNKRMLVDSSKPELSLQNIDNSTRRLVNLYKKQNKTY